MDLRQYYLAIQTIEETIKDNPVVVVSAATADGGRAGILSEVTSHTAARLIVEGKAVLATKEQTAIFSLWRQGPPVQNQPQTTAPPVAATTTIKSAATRPRRR
jgi:hypothetical protein